MKTKKVIINCTTGEVVEREMTLEELEIEAIYHQQLKNKQLILEAETEAKAAQKAALLDRLGITEEEAKLLLA